MMLLCKVVGPFDGVVLREFMAASPEQAMARFQTYANEFYVAQQAAVPNGTIVCLDLYIPWHGFNKDHWFQVWQWRFAGEGVPKFHLASNETLVLGG